MDAEKLAMQRRIDTLDRLANRLYAALTEAERENARLKAALETVKRQRDGLMSEVAGHCWACKNAKLSEISRSLFTCEFTSSVGMIHSKCEHWEWRGLCESNGGAEDA